MVIENFMQNKVIIILGPTATGKTKLGVKLAAKFSGEIISADSRQVYKGMDIGTGKDLEEFSIFNFQFSKKSKIKNQKSKILKIPYHSIDVVNPMTEFNVAKWLKLTKRVIADIHKRGKMPIIVGGTGLYISALVCGYNLAGTGPDVKLRKKLDSTPLSRLLVRLKKLDAMTFKKIDKKNKRRVVRALETCLKGKGKASELRKSAGPEFDFLILGVKKKREEINKLIDKRVMTRLDYGMVEEVKKLRKQGVSWKRLLSFGLEYRWISRYLRDEIEKDEMIEKLKTAIHQFAKRQMTWFLRMKDVRWVKNYGEAVKVVRGFLN